MIPCSFKETLPSTWSTKSFHHITVSSYSNRNIAVNNTTSYLQRNIQKVITYKSKIIHSLRLESYRIPNSLVDRKQHYTGNSFFHFLGNMKIKVAYTVHPKHGHLPTRLQGITIQNTMILILLWEPQTMHYKITLLTKTLLYSLYCLWLWTKMTERHY
jgi:hypothetical protein